MTMERPGVGAMTAAMRAAGTKSERNALRVGIVRGGKILRDRILSEPGLLSLGSAEQNSFVISGANVPRSLVLFEVGASGFSLRFTPAMTGRVSLGAASYELSTLVQSGMASTEQGAFVLSLPEHARGKLSLGEVSVLFERVAAPPRATPPQLPMAVRNNLGNSVDWLFTALVTASFITHFGFVAYLENADRPVDDVAERVRTAQLLMEDLDEPPPDDVAPPPLPPSGDEGLPSSTPSKGPKEPAHHAKGKTDGPEPRRPDSSALVAEAVRQAENLLLGVQGIDSAGTFADLLRSGAVTTDADDLFAAVQGSTIATHATAGLINTRQIGDGERTKGLGSLLPGRHDVGPISDGAPLREGEVHGKVDTGEPEEEGGSGELDAAEVTREIKRRLSAIRACYEHALRRDATLSGKLTVGFTVEQSGTFSHVVVRDDSIKDVGLAKCVTNTLAVMRLRRGPEGGRVDYSYPFVFRGEP